MGSKKASSLKQTLKKLNALSQRHSDEQWGDMKNNQSVKIANVDLEEIKFIESTIKWLSSKDEETQHRVVKYLYSKYNPWEG